MMNSDLKAMQQLVKVLEDSKSKNELTIDWIPGVFALISSGGAILRCNHELARLFGSEFETTLDRPFYELFGPESARLFEQRFKEFSSSAEERCEFEVSINENTPEERLFVWELRRFETQRRRAHPIYLVFGKDVTELRKRIAEVVMLAKDVEVTKSVQKLLLPKNTNVTSRNVELAAFYQPADQVGGDWWWHDSREDSRMLVLLGDVSGHGVGSAMVTAVLASSYNTIRLGNLDQSGSRSDFKRIFELLNRTLLETCGNSYCISITAVEIEFAKNLMRVWNAGGPPLIVRGSDGQARLIQQPSQPLGDWPMDLSVGEHELKRGDRMLLFSDGAFGFRDTENRRFSLKRLMELFTACDKSQPGVARDWLSTQLQSVRHNSDQVYDDMTFVLLDRK